MLPLNSKITHICVTKTCRASRSNFPHDVLRHKLEFWL